MSNTMWRLLHPFQRGDARRYQRTLGRRALRREQVEDLLKGCPFATPGGEVYLDNLRRLHASTMTRVAVVKACTCGKHSICVGDDE